MYNKKTSMDDKLEFKKKFIKIGAFSKELLPFK